MKYSIYQFISHSVEETEAVAAALAKLTPAGTVITLDGDLGAGKTAFTRGFAQGLGISPKEVSSPTFTIKHEYFSPTRQLFLHHFDVYRLANAEEFWRGGFQESFNGENITLIEWAGLILPALPKHAWRLRLEREELAMVDTNWFDLQNFDLTATESTKRKLILFCPPEALPILQDFLREHSFSDLGEERGEI